MSKMPGKRPIPRKMVGTKKPDAPLDRAAGLKPTKPLPKKGTLAPNKRLRGLD